MSFEWHEFGLMLKLSSDIVDAGGAAAVIAMVRGVVEGNG